MDLLREKALKIVNNRSNEIIKEFVEGKFDFKTATKSQFATLQDKLELHKYNLNSNDLTLFIDEKIKKDKSTNFFKDILKNYVEKREDILEFLNSSQEDTKVKNQIFREIFYLIKISFRKENALKALDI
ncbi:hypothetical protein [Candidatus Cetobacterium colombiensis]|uniref:Uncharacterized protein n=1 Tax=Candidatus Cetobacterium colombiensis TaxID=3073100 RepID=A0ABU4WDC2_9FUSO|nr:hypothetical protein [Candidatus Cetobacterium colombiensis]MDX8337012.1 hypothetical protein [Candidatus Cetobacterium colombiensis]